MWILRTFRTRENMIKFLDKNKGKIQYVEVFIIFVDGFVVSDSNDNEYMLCDGYMSLDAHDLKEFLRG